MFVEGMEIRGKPVEKYNHIDRRVDFQSKRSRWIYYDPKAVSSILPFRLREEVKCIHPIALDIGKIYHYWDFIQEQAERKLFLVFRLCYRSELPEARENGWYQIEARSMFDIFIAHEERKYVRNLRDDEKETGKINKAKWHLELKELMVIPEFGKRFK